MKMYYGNCEETVGWIDAYTDSEYKQIVSEGRGKNILPLNEAMDYAKKTNKPFGITKSPDLGNLYEWDDLEETLKKNGIEII